MVERLSLLQFKHKRTACQCIIYILPEIQILTGIKNSRYFELSLLNRFLIYNVSKYHDFS